MTHAARRFSCERMGHVRRFRRPRALAQLGRGRSFSCPRGPRRAIHEASEDALQQPHLRRLLLVTTWRRALRRHSFLRPLMLMVAVFYFIGITTPRPTRKSRSPLGWTPSACGHHLLGSSLDFFVGRARTNGEPSREARPAARLGPTTLGVPRRLQVLQLRGRVGRRSARWMGLSHPDRASAWSSRSESRSSRSRRP